MNCSRASGLFFLLLFLLIGCGKKINCFPHEHYAPEPDAPYTAEDVRIPTPEVHILAGTLTLPGSAIP
jgi:hypothetical protein